MRENSTTASIIAVAGAGKKKFWKTCKSLTTKNQFAILYLLAEETGYEDLDGIVLPGGMPGTMHLLENETVNAVIRKFAGEGKLVAAICAAPSVLGAAGLLEGKHATCHPGFEEKLTGATTSEDEVVVDGNIITSRGMGTAIPFAFEIVRYFTDDETVEHVRQGLVYRANEK